jgi:thiol-disulfide isomerase/thioredoxin
MFRYPILTIIIAIGLKAQSQENGIVFVKDTTLTNLLIQAENENKPIFIDCYTEWCVPCKEMARTIFPIKEVGDFFNSNFVNIAIDMDTEYGKMLRKKYNVSFYPTLLFLNSNMEIVHFSGGPGTKEDMILIGLTALERFNSGSVFKKLPSYEIRDGYMFEVHDNEE